MDGPAVQPTTSGAAFRVTILNQEMAEAYEDVFAVVDTQGGVVHVLSPDGRIHYLTIPLGSALVEWTDPTPLQPQPRIPPFGAGAFQRIQEGVQRMAEGMGGPL